MFEDFFGNAAVVSALKDMLQSGRIPQTILLTGAEGLGKATLVRRFAASLIGDAQKLERDDLSLESNVALIAEREKLPADKRAEDPLLFSSHPDFVTFAPDGPLRQISIQQIRLLKERAQFRPLKGSYRVFLIDGLDRANEQAANSLLKILEEPPPYLVVFATAQNAYDLLPTIRSRSIMFPFISIADEEMRRFAEHRSLPDADRRLLLAGGSPGAALSLDLRIYDRRRAVLLKLLQTAAGLINFSEWLKESEAVAAKSEKLESYLKILYGLLEDVLLLQQGASAIRNEDARTLLTSIATASSFDWIRRAVAKTDELVEMARRNIQKTIALDAFAADLSPAK